MTAYDEGYEDARRGYKKSDNPYADGSNKRKEWDKGFNDYNDDNFLEHNYDDDSYVDPDRPY